LGSVDLKHHRCSKRAQRKRDEHSRSPLSFGDFSGLRRGVWD